MGSNTSHSKVGRSFYRPAVGAWVAEFEPGDRTHYEFMWCVSSPTTYLKVAGLPRFEMYEYLTESILQCYEENKELVGKSELPADGFLGYVQGHSNCNPWMAWAMVQCIAEHLAWTVGEGEEIKHEGA